MCTVTYIPYDNGCWLTSNRDEKPGRHPTAPARWHTPPTGQPLYYATDAKAGGTWMATNAQGHTAVLLNGAGKPFVPQSHYARSRGLVLLDLLRAPNFVEAFAQADLHNIAPFTCIYVARHQLYACMWDGQTSETQALDDRVPYIWSSSTLYDATAQQQRQFWFGQWLQQNPEPCWQNILEFHHHQNEADPENSLRMQRSSGTQTLSISAVHLHARGPEFFYYDVLQPQPA
jgi:uncharacterized protein with NRDE domain